MADKPKHRIACARMASQNSFASAGVSTGASVSIRAGGSSVCAGLNAGRTPQQRLDVPREERQLPGMELGIKVVGKRRRATDPASCHRRALALMRQAEKICPFPRPRGFVFKARTWEEYEAWKKAQPNPRLW